MKKKITILNAANVYAQNLLPGLVGFEKVMLGDIYNSRTSFLSKYKAFKKDNSDVEVNHLNINSKTLMEEAVKDSHTVVYFTHDYFSNVQDKNVQLLDAAEISKSYNVNKFIAVAPIEFINYMTKDINDNPIKELNDTFSKALEINSNSILLKTDIIFGMNSYLLKYLKQSWALSYNAIDSNIFKHHKYNPLHLEDLNKVITSFIQNESTEHQGKKFVAQGNNQVSFYEIDNLIKQAFSENSKFEIPNTYIKLFNRAFQLLIEGNTHAINLEKMLQVIENKDNLNSEMEDAIKVLGINSKSFREYYSHLAENKDNTDDPELKYPNYHNYWRISLD